MAEQLTTEDWKDFRRELQEQKSKNRALNTSLVYKFCQAYGILCEAKTEYQLRLSKKGFDKVDIFPTSGKVHVLKKKNNTYKKVNIMDFLTKHFRTQSL